MIFLKQPVIGNSSKNDILSGIVVAIALVPEAIAFSFIAGVSPLVGLYTAFILGFITSIVGGKAGMISGATGAIAVVLISLGIEIHYQFVDATPDTVLGYILLTTILAGIFQILIGVFRLGKLIRLVPQPAMYVLLMV